MLGIPERPFIDTESGKELDEFQLADWLEGSITFATESISQNDVVDVLNENHLLAKSDDQTAKSNAAMKVKSAWLELERRQSCLGKSSSYRIKRDHVERVTDWKSTPAFAFCLLVGLRPVYRNAFSKLKDYNKQGELFERVTYSSLQALGWQVHSVGWSKTATNSIAQKVNDAANFIGVGPLKGATERWTAPKAKDAGLDVICQYIYRDGWSGKPIILTQCASGDNWEDKLHTPDLNTWRKLIDFTTAPVRGLAMPFVIRPDRFRKAAVRDNVGLLLDRNRLSVPEIDPSAWIPSDLKNDLNKWMTQRVERLLATAS